MGKRLNRRLGRRQRKILKAMWELSDKDGRITVEQIAKRTSLNAKDIPQTLRVMSPYLRRVSGKGRNSRWVLRTNPNAALLIVRELISILAKSKAPEKYVRPAN